MRNFLVLYFICKISKTKLKTKVNETKLVQINAPRPYEQAEWMNNPSNCSSVSRKERDIKSKFYLLFM